jgi:predicted nucleic acid-binding protein
VVDELGAGPIALDTVVFVYLIEDHPRYMPLVEPIFSGIDRGRWEAVTSAVTLLETLVVPYRRADAGLAERYEALLTRSRGLRLVDLDRPLLRAAARLRATVSVKTPDALQLAAALGMRATVFITNDRALPRLPGLRIVQLRDYAGPA